MSFDNLAIASKIRIYLLRGMIGLAIGGFGGAVVGAVVLGFQSWLTENPEEPAWIFAGIVLGAMFGTFIGSAIGFVIGMLTTKNVAAEEATLTLFK